MFLKWISGLLLVFTAAQAWSAIPVRQAAGEKRDHYLNAGVFVGGYDHGDLSLLNFRHSVNKTGMERVVLDVGAATSVSTNSTASADGAATARPGFFHVTIQKNPKRVVIDLEDLSQSKVRPDQVDKILQNSPYFSNASFYFDGRHRNLTIELPLKASAEIEVFELVSQGKTPGRIVMDVKRP